jgi:hypothetical protein
MFSLTPAFRLVLGATRTASRFNGFSTFLMMDFETIGIGSLNALRSR